MLSINPSSLAMTFLFLKKLAHSKWSFLFVCVFVVLVFTPSMNGPFILDDQNNVVYNELRFSSLNSSDYSLIDHVRERTFSKWTFIVNEKLFNSQNPKAFRVINLILHILNGFLLYIFIALIWRLTLNNGKEHLAGLIAMSLFLLHPIQTQSVNYITQRMTLLSVGFSLLSLILFLKLRNNPEDTQSAWPLRIGLFVSFMLALFSKPISICIMPFLQILEFLVIKNKSAKIQWNSFFIAGLIGIFLIALSIPGSIDTPRIGSLNYLATQSIVVFKYLSLVLWPSNLSIDHVQSIWPKIETYQLILTICGHSFAIAVAWFFRVKYPLVSLGILFTYVSFLPESGLIPLKDIMVEHRMYMPMIGISLLFSFIMIPLLERKWGLFFLVIVLTSLLVRTTVRNSNWANKVTLWSSALKSNPSSYRSIYSMGNIHLTNGDTTKSLAEYSRALSLSSTHVPSLSAMALIHTNRGGLTVAQALLSRGLKLEPRDVVSLQNMGYLMEKYNRPDDAIKYYKLAVKFSRGNPEPNVDLGTIYLSLNRADESIDQFKKAIAKGANSARLHNNLGFAHQIKGQTDLAKIHYLKAIQVDSSYYLAQQNLSSLTGSTK